MLNVFPCEKLYFIGNNKHAGAISCESNNILYVSLLQKIFEVCRLEIQVINKIYATLKVYYPS